MLAHDMEVVMPYRVGASAEQVVHRETRSHSIYANKTRTLIAIDAEMWVSTRGDHLARLDLGIDPSDMACSVCGRKRCRSIWLAMRPPHQIRCKACFTPCGDLVTAITVKRRDGVIVGQRSVLLR